jgi:V8-like Glu-specific endopeptidase
MAVTINPNTLPSGNAKPAKYPEVALVQATDVAGNGFNGTGFAIGKRWLLTASHVVYDEPVFDGLAKSILVAPGYDFKNINPPYTFADKVIYFTQVDPDRDGFIFSGDGEKSTLSGAELDIALIRTEKPILKPGSSGLKLQVLSDSSKAGVLGYSNGTQLKASSGSATKDSIDNTVFYDRMRLEPGMSGGPVFTREGVVSLVSTALFGASLDAHMKWITKAIKGDTQRGRRSPISRSHPDAQPNAALVISNGERLPADSLERFVQASEVESLGSLGKLKAFRSQKDIVDSITGLPVPQQVATDDINNIGVPFSREYLQSPIKGDGITLLAANERLVSRIIDDSAIFDKSGIHVFGNKTLEKDVSGKAIIVVSDATPGFQGIRDSVYFYKGSLGQDLFSSIDKQTLS